MTFSASDVKALIVASADAITMREDKATNLCERGDDIAAIDVLEHKALRSGADVRAQILAAQKKLKQSEDAILDLHELDSLFDVTQEMTKALGDLQGQVQDASKSHLALQEAISKAQAELAIAASVVDEEDRFGAWRDPEANTRLEKKTYKLLQERADAAQAAVEGAEAAGREIEACQQIVAQSMNEIEAQGSELNFVDNQIVKDLIAAATAEKSRLASLLTKQEELVVSKDIIRVQIKALVAKMEACKVSEGSSFVSSNPCEQLEDELRMALSAQPALRAADVSERDLLPDARPDVLPVRKLSGTSETSFWTHSSHSGSESTKANQGTPMSRSRQQRAWADMSDSDGEEFTPKQNQLGSHSPSWKRCSFSRSTSDDNSRSTSDELDQAGGATDEEGPIGKNASRSASVDSGCDSLSSHIRCSGTFPSDDQCNNNADAMWMWMSWQMTMPMTYESGQSGQVAAPSPTSAGDSLLVVKFCPHCGGNVKEGHAFCQFCGSSLTLARQQAEWWNTAGWVGASTMQEVQSEVALTDFVY